MIAETIKATQGSEGAQRATEIPWSGAPKEVTLHRIETDNPPDPEVPAKAVRRRFTAEYKVKILKEADACTKPGSLGALLRREGLYASNLTPWNRRRRGAFLPRCHPRN